MIKEVFRANIATSATWVFGGGQNPVNLDTHDSQSAAQMPTIAAGIISDIAEVLRFLKETPFDQTRSFQDVTTLMVSTEFARTMRQTFTDFERSGNDHNPLNNSIILAGKGIAGGQVIGQSNFRTEEEIAAGAQGAHMAMDSMGLTTMGKVFSYSDGSISDSMPETYTIGDYLNINAVVNSLYTAFDVSPSLQRTNDRNGPPAPVVPGLLAE